MRVQVYLSRQPAGPDRAVTFRELFKRFSCESGGGGGTLPKLSQRAEQPARLEKNQRATVP